MARVNVLTKVSGKAHPRIVAEATEEIIARKVQRNSSGAAAVFDDENTTTITVGGGAAQTSMTLGKASQTATFLGSVQVDQNVTVTGNLTVNGTTTTINTDNLSVEDDLIVLRNLATPGAAAAAGIVVERGTTSANDATMLWSETNGRFELGMFASAGGTNAAPTTLSTFEELKIQDLLLAGTAVTADAGLTVTATAAALTLAATGSNIIQFTTNATSRWNINGSGHLLANTDNTLDIGASGATRPRTGYFGTSVIIGSSITVTTDTVSSSGVFNLTAGGALTQTAGGIYTATQSAGGSAGSGSVGFAFSNTGSAGATGTAAASPTASGNGGAMTVTAGVGGAAVGTNTGGQLGADGGVGGALTIKPGTGGAGSAGTVDPGHAGNGGAIVISGGDGGNGAGTSDNGSGGGLELRGGAAGTGGSGAAGTAGTLSLGITSATGAVNMGTGAAAHTITVGSTVAATTVALVGGATSGVTIDSNGTISLDAATASNFTVSGATSDLTLGARAATITLNQSGNTTLSGFTATSIIGALNELKSSGVAQANAVANSYSNNTGSTIPAGYGVRMTTTASNIDLANATSDGAAANYFGAAVAAIANTASGTVSSEGVASLAFVAGLTLAVGDEVFLSTTSGLFTNVAPSTSGNVVLSVGFVKVASTYAGSAGDLASCQLVRGSKTVI